MEYGTGGEGYGGAVPASWASWLNVIAGIWEILAPWIWGYSILAGAVWNDVITGIVIVIFGAWAANVRYSWPSWWNVAFGIWLIIAPFVLGYGRYGRPAGNDVIVGIIVVILALIAALSKPAGYRSGGQSAG